MAEPTGSDGEVKGIPLNEAPVWQRALIMLAGAGMNFVLGFVVMAILITAQSEPITSKVLYQVEENALCGQTGLQAGDKILAVNGRRCFVANDILYELMRTEDYTADFTVLRDGKKVERPAAVKSSVAFKALLSGAQSVCRTKVSKPVVRVPGR